MALQCRLWPRLGDLRRRWHARLEHAHHVQPYLLLEDISQLLRQPMGLSELHGYKGRLIVLSDDDVGGPAVADLHRDVEELPTD